MLAVSLLQSLAESSVVKLLSQASFVQFAIKAKVFRAEAFGYVRDLSVVEAEMLDDLVDGVQSMDVIALNFVGGEVLVWGKPVEDLRGFGHGGAEAIEKFGCGKATDCRELCGAVALVLVAVERGHEPLGDVAVEMEDYVADAVAGFVGAPPNLFGGHGFHTCFEARPVLVQELVA